MYIRRKLSFQGKVFYCGRFRSTYEDSPFEQEDEEQQPPTEQHENRKHQDLPAAIPELHQDAETPSERNKVEQNHAAPRQPTVQECRA